jgi:hypothetical protein
MDAAEIIPESELFYFNNPQTSDPDLGPFSDLFRFKLLWMRGGWYFDVDTICLAAVFPSSERAWARECPEYHPRAIGPGQIAFPIGDPVVEILYLRCLERSRNYTHREALGPNLITEVISELHLPLDIGGSPDTFYPLRWIEMFKLVLSEFHEEVDRKAKNATFLPIFQSFFEYSGIDLSKTPPRGSYLHQFYEQLAPDLMSQDAYSDEQIWAKSREFILSKQAWAIPELVTVCGRSIITRLGI